MKSFWFCFPLVGFLAVGGTPSYGELIGAVSDVVEKIGEYGKIDWSNGVVMAVGVGVPPTDAANAAQARTMAKRAALVVAQRNLLKTLRGVRVDSVTMGEDFIAASDRMLSAAQGIVRGATERKTQYRSDDSVEVTIAVKLAGALTEELLPKASSPAQPAVLPAPPSEPSAMGPVVTSSPLAGPVLTGLVVDSRGLNIRPAMAPKILDEEGREVYGSAYAKREYAIQQGMAGYSKDLAAAQAHPRVANHPLTVKGVRTAGSTRTDIVISNADGARIRSEAENLDFLEKCRVMIVMD